MASELHRIIVIIPGNTVSYYVGAISGKMTVTKNPDKALEVTRTEGNNISLAIWQQLQVKSLLEPFHRELEDNLRMLTAERYNGHLIRVYKLKSKNYTYTLDNEPIDLKKRLPSYKRSLVVARLRASG